MRGLSGWSFSGLVFAAMTGALAFAISSGSATAQTLKGGAQENHNVPDQGDVFSSHAPDPTLQGSVNINSSICARDTARLAHEVLPPGWGPHQYVSISEMTSHRSDYWARCAVDACHPNSAVCWRNLNYLTPEQEYRIERARSLQSVPPPPDCRKGPPGAYDPSQNPRCENRAQQPRPPQQPQQPQEAVFKICTATQLAQIDFERYNNGLPISIAQVAGAGGGRSYVIFLAGTEFKANQSNSISTDFSEAADIASQYDIAVMDAIIGAIPAGSDVMFVGHSLGGMVAQNLTRRFAQAGFHNGKLTVTRVVTFGSPKTGQDVPGVTYRRFVVFGDPVPSLSWPFNGPAAGVTVIDGGPGLHMPMLGEHLAYPQSQALRAFDALGELQGGNCLELRQQGWTYPAAAR